MPEQRGTSYVIRGGKIVLKDRVVAGGTLVVEDGKIRAIKEPDEESAPVPRETGHPERSGAVVDARERIVLPGFIDVHVHGGGGFHFSQWGDGFVRSAQTHSRYGTTALLATLSPPFHNWEQLDATWELIGRRDYLGPEVLGLHYEGPYLNPKRPGAIPPDHLREPNIKEISAVVRRTGAALQYMTVAPELPGAAEALSLLREHDIVVSAGHTDATFAQVRTAVAAGLSGVTHLYNAMRGFHHREPGVVGAAWLLPELTAELIGDGVHVSKEALQIAFELKGADRLMLITDAIPAAGAGDGDWEYAGFTIYVRNGVARDKAGSLAGSTATMARSFQNAVQLIGASLPEATRMCSLTPARVLGIDHRKGSLDVGKDADIAICTPDFTVEKTIVQGRLVWDARAQTGQKG